MRFFNAFLISALALAGISRPAQAQDSRARQGFWWGVGVGYGWVHVRCDICQADRKAALTATGGLGGTITRSVRFGAELSGWTRGEENIDEYLGSLSAILNWYPNPDGAFHLKGGLGYVAYRIDDGEDDLTSSGFGPLVGAGFEIGLGRRASVEPYLSAIVTIPRGNLQLNGDRQAEGVSLSLVQFGLGVTLH